MPRKASPSDAYECVGGPFDGDAIACGANSCVEVSWGGAQKGHYVHARLGKSRILRWVPLELD